MVSQCTVSNVETQESYGERGHFLVYTLFLVVMEYLTDIIEGSNSLFLVQNLKGYTPNAWQWEKLGEKRIPFS